jgi:hypothetical protein
MGFFLTLLYLVTAYLGPATIFGPLAEARIGLILAGLLLLLSLPTLTGSLIWKTPQSLALIGLAFATFLSLLVTGWASGAVQVMLDFIPNAFAYFLVCLHCNSKKKLQFLIFMMLFVCLFDIAQGYNDLEHQPTVVTSGDPDPVGTPYLLPQSNGPGDWFYRIRGQDFINDPNDFAQLIACTAPLVFIFWRPKKLLRNVAFVIIPVSVLLFGAFLTHSRGGMLAIFATALVASRRRIGTLPALLVTGGLFVAASALNFTGGRDISADSGAERMDLWGQGLQLLKSHPVFGVGFGKMPDYTGLTAHNSIVVCAAELGLFGLFFWSLFLFPTVRDALVIASPKKVSDRDPIESIAEPEKTYYSQAITKIELVDKAEINRLGSLVVLSLTGFLVAGWFLSRAFTMTLFLLGGIAEVVFEMALERGMVVSRMSFSRVLRYTAGFTIALLVLTYVVLRVGNRMR